MTILTRIVLAAGLAGLPLAVPPSVGAQVAGIDDSVRSTTLGTLVEYVDDGAQFVLEEAREALGALDPQETALVRNLEDFAGQARRLHEDVDDPDEENVRRPLDRMRTLARRINTRLRRQPELRELYEDWAQVTRDLADIDRVLLGRNVTLRRPDPEWSQRSGHEHADPPTAWPAEPLGEREVAEFRRLAHELDQQVQRVLTLAEQDRADYTGRGEEHLRTLRAFKNRTAALHRQTDANVLRASQLGASVDHLLWDARRADTAMRQARVYSGVWEEWGKVARMLDEMRAVARRAAN